MELYLHSSCLTTVWHPTHLGMAQVVTTWLVWLSHSAHTAVPTRMRTPRNASWRSGCLRRTATTAKNPKRNRANVSGRLHTLLTLFWWSQIRLFFSQHKSIELFFFMDDSPRKCFSLKTWRCKKIELHTSHMSSFFVMNLFRGPSHRVHLVEWSCPSKTSSHSS